MTVDTKEVVTAIAYLIGVRKSALETSFREECPDTLDTLYASKEATIIRYLSKLRTSLFQHFKKTDDAMRYDLKNLTSLEWYDKDNIRQLLAVECTVHIEDVDGKLQCQVCQTDLLIIRHIVGNEICIHPGRTPAQQ